MRHLTHCYICEKSDLTNPNIKITYHGKRKEKRVQKTIRLCINCGSMMTDEEIKDYVRDWEGWD